MYQCRIVFFLITIICLISVVTSDEFSVELSNTQDHDYKHQNWQAVNPSVENNQEFDNRYSEVIVPEKHLINTDYVPRRRRPLRKRKRGPNFADRVIRPRINDPQDKEPQRLIDQEYLLKDNWQEEALVEEATPYRRNGQKRRRIGPKYNEDDNQFTNKRHDYEFSHEQQDSNVEFQNDNYKREKQYQSRNDPQIINTQVEANLKLYNEDDDSRNKFTVEDSTKINDKSYRKPYTPQRNRISVSSTESSHNLKTLLKQTNGALSLSEILQKKNISLADLLTGKHQAISALTDSPIIPTNPINENEQNRNVYIKSTKILEEIGDEKISEFHMNNNNNESSKRRLPHMNIYKNNSKQNRQDPLSMRDHINAQRKRLSNLHNNKENKIFTDLIHFEVVTEATTEKRIFIPANTNKILQNDYNQKYSLAGEREDNKEIVNKSDIILTNNYNENMTTSRIPDISTYTTISTSKLPEQKTESTKLIENTITTENSYHNDMIIRENGHVITRNRLALKPKLRITNIYNARVFPKTDFELKHKHGITTDTNLDSTTKKYENKYNQSTREELSLLSPIPKNAVIINIKEVFGLSNMMSNDKIEKNHEGPLKISMNLDEIYQNISDVEKEVNEQITTTQKNNFNEETSIISVIASTHGPRIPTAEEEIMEVMKDTQGRARLGKVLALKNLTLEELVALRERGSSQLHLADIFNNQNQEPNSKHYQGLSLQENQIPKRPNDNPIDNIDRLDKTDEELSESIESKEIKKDSDGSSYFTSVVKILPPKTDEMFRQHRKYNIFESNMQTQYNNDVEVTDLQSKNNSTDTSKTVYPAWKSYVYPNIYTPFDNSYLSRPAEVITSKYDKIDEPIQDLERVEQLESNIADTFNNNFKVDIKSHRILEDDDDDSFLQLPSGVKSAIIASIAIIGSSLIIFITIFVACKWRQKQTRRLRYVNSFSGKIRSPILESQRKEKSKRNLNPVMITSTDIKTSFIDTETDNHQQYLWESLRKPIY